MSATVWIDYSADLRVASMSIGGMSVLERVLREAAAAGATRAIVMADADQLPRLPALRLTVEIVAPRTATPSEARAISGHTIAGVVVSDERSRRRAERALLETCRRPYDGIGDRYISRSVSLRITRVLARLGATPNQVTFANILVGLAACGFAQHGTPRAFAIAGVLIWLQVVLDSCDGELARIRYMGSRFGMWLDNVSDDVIDNLFVLSVAIGLGGTWPLVGVVVAGMRAVYSLMIYRAVARAGRPGDVISFRWWFDKADDELAERYDTRFTLLSLFRGIGRRDLYVLLWGAACVAQVPLVAVGLGSAIFVTNFGLGVAHLIATRRQP